MSEKNLDHIVSWESEEKCFKKVVLVTVLSAAKMLNTMRTEVSIRFRDVVLL